MALKKLTDKPRILNVTFTNVFAKNSMRAWVANNVHLQQQQKVIFTNLSFHFPQNKRKKLQWKMKW